MTCDIRHDGTSITRQEPWAWEEVPAAPTLAVTPRGALRADPSAATRRERVLRGLVGLESTSSTWWCPSAQVTQ